VFRRLSLAGLVLPGLLWAGDGRCQLQFEVNYLDEPGEGFFDEASWAEAAGNTGTTLGEQRRLAFEAALEIWAAALDSPVAIRVDARFTTDLFCDASNGVLGRAAPASALQGFSGAPTGYRFYASALADRLAGYDLSPGDPDIVAEFNAALDTDGCLAERRWDYAIEASAGPTSLLNTALHELAHGLGFTNFVGSDTGSGKPGFGPFDGLLFDAVLGRYWDEMSPEERVQSARSPRQLLWAGAAVNLAAPSVLARGAPFLDVMSGAERRVFDVVSEVPGTVRPSERVAGGPLVVWNESTGCELSALPPSAVVLVAEIPGCASLTELLLRAQREGASSALVASVALQSPPVAPTLDTDGVRLTVLALTAVDWAQLGDLAAGGATAVLRTQPQGRLGVSRGMVLMNATDPAVDGSSVSHFDPIARRDGLPALGLLMEPSVTDRVANDVTDLSVYLLRDIGWADAECGNGIVEPGEGCDQGTANSDEEADACREDCRIARCGDGVVDRGESCDIGPALGECPRDCGVDTAPTWPDWIDPPPWDGPLGDADAGSCGAADECPPGGPGPTPDAAGTVDAGVHGAALPDAAVRPSSPDADPAGVVEAGAGARGDVRRRGVDDSSSSGCRCSAVGVERPRVWELTAAALLGWMLRRRSARRRDVSH